MNEAHKNPEEIKAGIQAGIDRAAEISRKWKAGEIRFPKGVFRFKTFEEADEWERKILAGEPPPKDSYGH